MVLPSTCRQQAADWRTWATEGWKGAVLLGTRGCYNQDDWAALLPMPLVLLPLRYNCLC
jgi:hypothetical protein